MKTYLLEMALGIDFHATEQQRSELISFCRGDSIPLFAGVGCDTPRFIDSMLAGGESSIRQHVRLLLDSLNHYDVDGLEVDYEEFQLIHRSAFRHFIALLDSALRDECKYLAVTVQAPGDVADWMNRFDYRAIIDSSDEVKVMCYDMNFWPGMEVNDRRPAPDVPLHGYDDSSRQSLLTLDSVVTRLCRFGAYPFWNKVSFGFPLYGYDHWKQTSSTWSHEQIRYSNVVALNAGFPKRLWDGEIPHYDFMYGIDNVRSVWFEDDTSFGNKLDYALEKRIRGVAAWQIGDCDPNVYASLIKYKNGKRCNKTKMLLCTKCPVDMQVVDPSGRILSKATMEDSTSVYVELPEDSTGAIEDEIHVWRPKHGRYGITILPDSSASPTSTYTLTGSQGDSSVVLAQDVRVEDIPAEPYGFWSSVHTLQYGSRWNMISLPNKPENCMRVSLYPSASSRAFAYADRYIPQDTLQFGQGYWLKFSLPTSVTIAGSDLFVDTVPVVQGWNMIGSLSIPIAAASITSDPPGMVTSQCFGYQKRYTISDTIETGKGYWIKVSGTGKLILSSTDTAHLAKRSGNRIQIVPTSELPPLPPNEEATMIAKPIQYSLDQNYPNPFNPITKFNYQLPVDSKVNFRIFNVLGQLVSQIVDGVEYPGFKSFQWNASEVTSGVYFYRLEAVDVNNPSNRFVETKKMILIR